MRSPSALSTTIVEPVHPISLLRPRRTITGMSAVLLPFGADGMIDWEGFESHLHRTARAGLIPAVNMDTGYGPQLDEPTRLQVLGCACAVLGKGPLAAGVVVTDWIGDCFNIDAYSRAAGPVLEVGATPVVFQSYGLSALRGAQLADAYARIGQACGKFIAFELGRAFAPFGTIYDLDSYAQLLGVPQCIGAKHSSLRRELEWQRLALRDRLRPDFMVLSGNDLALDMVMYGSDYLLGLSTFAPEHFARRDALWASGDHRFFELNDVLQYLGQFAFREPVPAYKHSAAQFLKARGLIGCDRPHPSCPTRPQSDREILEQIARRLEQW